MHKREGEYQKVTPAHVEATWGEKESKAFMELEGRVKKIHEDLEVKREELWSSIDEEEQNRIIEEISKLENDAAAAQEQYRAAKREYGRILGLQNEAPQAKAA